MSCMHLQKRGLHQPCLESAWATELSREQNDGSLEGGQTLWGGFLGYESLIEPRDAEPG